MNPPPPIQVTARTIQPAETAGSSLREISQAQEKTSSDRASSGHGGSLTLNS